METFSSGFGVEFGNKQALFDAALERYDDLVIGRSFGPLEQSNAGASEIAVLLEFFSEASKGNVMGRGCLLCNTAVELGPLDPSGAGLVRDYFERLSGAFENAIKNAVAAGELKAATEVAATAHFFTSSVLGLFVLLRANAEPILIQNAAAVAISHLDSLRA